MRLAVLSAFMLICFVADIDAGDRRERRRARQGRNTTAFVASAVMTASPSVSAVPLPTGQESKDSLDEVNAERAKRGLQPFTRDPLLCQAAYACAKARAASHIHGHLSSDFDYLPAGARATAAGCGAWLPGEGWGTCCTYDSYQTAGAAWVVGSDGKRYMHLFVR